MSESTEKREGKALSAEHTGLLAKAHAALAAVLAHADPDDLEDAAGDGDVGNLDGANGPDGTQGEPNPDPAEAEDGAGSRASVVVPIIRGGPTPAIQRVFVPGGGEYR